MNHSEMKRLTCRILIDQGGNQVIHVLPRPGIQLLKISALTDAIDLARSKKLSSQK